VVRREAQSPESARCRRSARPSDVISTWCLVICHQNHRGMPAHAATAHLQKSGEWQEAVAPRAVQWWWYACAQEKHAIKVRFRKQWNTKRHAAPVVSLSKWRCVQQQGGSAEIGGSVESCQASAYQVRCGGGGEVESEGGDGGI